MLPDVPLLLATAEEICGYPVDLVSVDMPLSHMPITGRRGSDTAISRAYGARHCSTHSPSASRPGSISDSLTWQFAQMGFPLLTERIAIPGIIEVYPHPALVELSGSTHRLPYKISKMAKNWPELNTLQRREKTLQQWDAIASMLAHEITGVSSKLPKLKDYMTLVEMKAFEDCLDAVVCVWVGICAIEGRALPFGDLNSAIWVPESQSNTRKRALG
jgi:predicted RNase H-like nuclease